MVHTTITGTQKVTTSQDRTHLHSDTPTGFRRVVEVLAVTGRVENRHVETEPVFTYQNGKYIQGLGNPERIFERGSSHYSEVRRA